MKNKVISLNEAMNLIHDGSKIMIGGFSSVGAPLHLLNALADRGTKDLFVIADDLGQLNKGFSQGCYRLVENRQISKAVLTFIGANPMVGEQYINGKMEIEFLPMGTLIEKIRSGGVGIGGFYTPVGVGTPVEEGKETKVIDGKKQIFETAIRADVALVKARKSDRKGNAVFNFTSANFNIIMAMASDTVILEVEELVEIGEIAPNEVQLPGVLVDHIVCKEEVII